MEYKKKLIEVDLPLNEINEASSREKSLRHGHPSTLHLWWARRPTATARAVLFAQLVDDPSSHPELFPTEEAQKTERDRLFKIIKKLSVWENSNDTYLLSEAISEIKKYVPDFDTLKVLDPFSGGGTIPLEGQRLGMTPICHDLNPVALTIEKAMVDIPARFQNGPAINPESRQKKLDNVWNGTIGLATDIEYYGKLLRKLTEEKIGNLYPKVNVNGELLTPIGYLWARTIECPNPGCKKQIPLVKSFNLSVVKGKECSWYPVLQENGDWIPTIKNRLADKEIEATVGNGKVTCPFCHGTIDCEKACSGEEKIKERLCCIILDSKSSRLYLPSNDIQEACAFVERPLVFPDANLPKDKGAVHPGYGYQSFNDLFSNRQLIALLTFSEQLKTVEKQCYIDAIKAGLEEGTSLDNGGDGAMAYSQAIKVYLAFVIDKLADYNCKCCTWHNGRQQMRDVFGRQAIARSYDYCESNPFSNSSGCFDNMLQWVYESALSLPGGKQGIAEQFNAQDIYLGNNIIVSTDPPYYDNIDYSDLSDFFYLWLKWNLQDVYPNFYKSTVTPKKEELIANGERMGSKQKAEQFFEDGMMQACKAIYQETRKDIPVTIYYAYKQSSESDEGEYASSGWETMLKSLIDAGFQITSTWPMRTEMKARLLGWETNALASSIVISCRIRSENAPSCSKTDFINELSSEFSKTLEFLSKENIAPVDLQQAMIGPGMSIFSKYKEIRNADGSVLSVHEALNYINQEINHVFNKEASGLDSVSQTCLFMYENYGYSLIKGGEIESLVTAKDTNTAKLFKEKVISGEKGQIQLSSIESFADSKSFDSISTWPIAMMITAAYDKKTIDGAAEVLAKINNDKLANNAKNLLYRLYMIASKKGMSSDAIKFNGPVSSWTEIKSAANKLKETGVGVQGTLF